MRIPPKDPCPTEARSSTRLTASPARSSTWPGRGAGGIGELNHRALAAGVESRELLDLDSRPENTGRRLHSQRAMSRATPPGGCLWLNQLTSRIIIA